MSARLVGEVAAWLATPAAKELTAAERLVLLIIAERTWKDTRRFRVHAIDKWDDGTSITATETIAMRAGVTVDGLTKVLRRLAEHGVEVRVPIGKRRDGSPVFAVRGRATDYRIPELPASVELPARPSG
ncbi:hypothetical protein [Nonomuraea maritima]|uniref:hypothetical protein n=1 Tax=Nonomuraea maritima TaxID=683260 RepID=UPI003721E4BF